MTESEVTQSLQENKHQDVSLGQRERKSMYLFTGRNENHLASVRLEGVSKIVFFSFNP